MPASCEFTAVAVISSSPLAAGVREPGWHVIAVTPVPESLSYAGDVGPVKARKYAEAVMFDEPETVTVCPEPTLAPGKE
jgi:hypothetical protein